MTKDTKPKKKLQTKKKTVKKIVKKVVKKPAKGKGVGVNGNLNPIKKGEVRNPKGRPLGSKNGIRSRLQALLKKNPKADFADLVKDKKLNLKGADNAEALALVLLRSALLGDLRAIDMALEQTEEALPKQVKLGDNDGNPINPVLVYIPDNGRNK